MGQGHGACAPRTRRCKYGMLVVASSCPPIHSCMYQFIQWRWGEPAKNPSVALTWVNGINYTSAEVEEQAHFLSTLFGCRVRPYYNPSLGGWLRDLTRVSYMYIRAPTEDPVVTGLAKHLSMVRTHTHTIANAGRLTPSDMGRPADRLTPARMHSRLSHNRCCARSGRGAGSCTWRTAGGRCSPTSWPSTTSSE